MVQVTVEQVLGRNGLVLAGEVQGDHDHEGVEALTDHHGDRVEHRSVHHRCGGLKQHAQRVEAVEQAEGQRDTGGPVDQGVAERLTGRTGPVQEALEAHLERDLVRPGLLGLTLPPVDVVAALAAARVVTPDGTRGPVGASLRVFNRLVLEGRFDTRNVHEVRAGVTHELRRGHGRAAGGQSGQPCLGVNLTDGVAVGARLGKRPTVVDGVLARGLVVLVRAQIELRVAVLDAVRLRVVALLLVARGGVGRGAGAEGVHADDLTAGADTLVGEAGGGQAGARDAGHLIAFSVWGLSTERIETYCTRPTNWLLAWCSTLVNSFSKCITPHAKNNEHIIPLKIKKVNTTCLLYTSTMNHDFTWLKDAPDMVARRLLGCIFERTVGDERVCVKIVETEAYHQSDAASHSYKGRTPRTEIMFGEAGRLYVYFTYGMHYCMNVVTGPAGEGSAVLIRAVEPLDGWETLRKNRPDLPDQQLTNGPAKLAKALGVDLAMNGHDLAKEPLQLIVQPPIDASKIVQTTRIGISQAKDVPWRFYVRDNPFVSKR